MDCYSFYEKYQQNDNEWWKLSEGEMQNLYDDAMGLLFGTLTTTSAAASRVTDPMNCSASSTLRRSMIFLRFGMN